MYLQIFPNYTTDDTASVSKFIDTSGDSIDYYMKSGDIKQVTMKAEVAGRLYLSFCIHFYTEICSLLALLSFGSALTWFITYTFY